MGSSKRGDGAVALYRRELQRFLQLEHSNLLRSSASGFRRESVAKFDHDSDPASDSGTSAGDNGLGVLAKWKPKILAISRRTCEIRHRVPCRANFGWILRRVRRPRSQ